jgi:hypothetical protein
MFEDTVNYPFYQDLKNKGNEKELLEETACSTIPLF